MVGFGNPGGLVALLGVLALIAFYLYFKRPVKKIFPSIMFFIKKDQSKSKSFMFRRFLSNSLFFVQLLALALLGLAVATPFLNAETNTTDQQIVLIIDSSASMQTISDGNSRFDLAMKDARDIASRSERVSIILAEEFPIVAADGILIVNANAALDALSASDTTSNIGDAMLQAMTLVDGGTVYVFSDFASVSGTDPIVAKRQLNARGTKVVFKEYGEPARNVGIISADVQGDKAFIKVKNFFSGSVTTTLKSTDFEKTLDLGPQDLQEIEVALMPGQNQFYLDLADDLVVDNSVFLYNPKDARFKALFISNSRERSSFRTALESLNLFDITDASPPVIPDEEFDVYFIHEVDKAKLLPASFSDLNRAASRGASVIVHSQSDSGSIDYDELGLVTLESIGNGAALVDVVQNDVTNDLYFSDVSSYFQTSTYDCNPWVKTTGDHVIICAKQVGDGHVLWYGISEKNSDFKNTPSYPLFWNAAIHNLKGIDQEERNLKTGALIPLGYTKVETPSGDLVTNRLVLDQRGFYTYYNRTIAANLVSFDESNVNSKYELIEENAQLSEGSATSQERPLAKDFMLIALILVIFEFIVIKWRGDV